MKRHAVHKYQRAKLGKATVWRCVLGGCLHYVHNDFILGLESICKCGRKFTIDRDKARRKNPKCDTCQSQAALAQKGILFHEEASVREEFDKTVENLNINIDDLLEGLE